MKALKCEICILITICLLRLVIIFLISTSCVTLELNGFAVEDGKIFLGLSNRIEVLENDVCIATIPISRFTVSGSYVFVLENNQISAYYSLSKETFDLQGNVIHTQQYNNTDIINVKLKQKQTYTDSNGVVYQQKNVLGYYYIVNLQTEKTVYRMPIWDYVAKVLQSVSDVVLVITVLSMIIKMWDRTIRGRRQSGDGSLID